MRTGLVAFGFPLRLKAGRLRIGLSRPLVPTRKRLTGPHGLGRIGYVIGVGRHTPNRDRSHMLAMALRAGRLMRHLPSIVRGSKQAFAFAGTVDSNDSTTRLWV